MAVNAPAAGTVKEFLVNEEDTVTVGQDLLKLELNGGGKTGEQDQKVTESKTPTSEDQGPPKSEKRSSQQNISPSPSPSTPPSKEESNLPRKEKPAVTRKEPTKQDEPSSKVSESKRPASESPNTKSPYGSRDEKRVNFYRNDNPCCADNRIQVKMNRMRLRIAERLKQSQNTAASLTTFNEVDMSSIMQFRKLYKDEVLKKTGVKLDRKSVV